MLAIVNTTDQDQSSVKFLVNIKWLFLEGLQIHVYYTSLIKQWSSGPYSSSPYQILIYAAGNHTNCMLRAFGPRPAPSIIVLRAQPWCLTLCCSRFTHSLQKFCPKIRFEASQAVFWSLSCYKEPKPTIKLFTGCALCDLLIQMQNISLRSLGMCRKQNFVIVLGFKSDKSITFHFLSSPLFLLFLPHFFSFAWHLCSRLHFWESF